MEEKRNSIIAGIAFGIVFGIPMAFMTSLQAALFGAPISGLLFGGIIFLFINSKTVKHQTAIQTMDGEAIIRSGGANHFMKSEAVGGKLYLLNSRLHFKSHSFNIQNHVLDIPLNEIIEIGLYNVTGFVPNGLSITSKNGSTEKFVLNGRSKWKADIEAALNKR